MVEGDDPGWSATIGEPHATADGGAPALVAEAIRELRAMRSTRYRHKTRVDEASGTFEFDCSGFVAYALWRVNEHALGLVPVGVKGRPRAEDFVTFFTGLSATDAPWRRVEHGGDVAPGDVIAWLRPADLIGTNTGHLAIVLDRLGQAKPSKAVAAIGGARELLLRVVDSTDSPHADDARGDETTTGLGSGTIGLVVDAGDVPIGYRWRGGKSPKAWTTTIAIARLP
ncbi:MAG: hypothetical protein HYV09_22985 [Deltaproteobacteria bacterium]|nr:hypothetical protein [Deltaproteobacteria bacterium]